MKDILEFFDNASNAPVLTSKLRSDITDMIRKILKDTHTHAAKHKFKGDDERSDRLNFACPYCGDSEDDPYKKRGNLHWDTLYFHCYNDGCKKHVPLTQMLSDFGTNVKNDDYFSISKYIKINKRDIVKATALDFGLFQLLNDIAIDRESFKAKFNVYDINENTYRAYPYLKSRLLHKKLENFMYKPSTRQLYVLNLNPDGTKILGYQVRNLDKKSKQKYLSYTIDAMRKAFNLEMPNESNSVIEKLIKMSMIFGILRVNLTKPYTIFEGPIDSFFMNNAIAITGVEKEAFDFDDLVTTRYMFDNDDAGRVKMMSKINKKKTCFLWTKFLKDNNLHRVRMKGRGIKDLNELIEYCYKKKRTDALANLNDYFSNDPLDIISI